jgi:hypothetical protein
MADIKYVITVDSQGAVSSIKNFENAVDGTGGTSDKTGTKIAGLGKQFFGAQIAVDLAKKGFNFFKEELLSMPAAAMEGEKAQRALESALQTTGRTVPTLARHYDALASSLQKQTIYDDEAIKGAETLLLQMTRLDRDGIERATKGAIGLATVMGTDLQSAAMMVTKAMEGNYIALARYGIKIDETLSAEGKQAQLLDKLNVLYGRAQSETDTMAGRLSQLKNAWDDAKEALGKYVVENEGANVSLEALKMILENIPALIDKFGESFQRGMASVPAVANFVRVLIVLAGAAQRAGDEARASQAGWAALKDVFFKIEERGNGVTDTLDKLREKAKALGIPLKADLTKNLIEAERALAELQRTGETTPATLEKARKKVQDLKDELYRCTPEAKKFVEVWGDLKDIDFYVIDEGRKKLDNFIKPVKGAGTALDELDAGWSKIAAGWAKKNSLIKPPPVKDWQKWADEARKAIDIVASNFQLFYGIIAQSYQNRMAAQENALTIWYNKQKSVLDQQFGTEKAVAAKRDALEAEYAEKRKAIEADLTLSAEERSAKLLALEDTYDKKRDEMELKEKERMAAEEKLKADFESRERSLRRAQAIAQKNTSTVQAIINTAEGVTRAWALGPILGPILSVIVAAAGAFQIALIRSQPIPLGRGGILTRRAFSADGKFEAGEAGEEAVVPLPRGTAARAARAIAGEGAGRPIYLYQDIYIGGKRIKQVVTEIVQEGLDSKRIKVKSATVN